MYKLLLSWRYLSTRYIALASIVSVTLGVATMIVVNAVMSGFTTEMQDRIHGILSDVIFESRNMAGFADAEWHMDRIREVAGDQIEAMTPTVRVPAMLSFRAEGENFTLPVMLIGIDPARQNDVSDFGKYLQHPANRERMSFALREGGYDDRDHQGGPEASPRPQMREAGSQHRREMLAHMRALAQIREKMAGPKPVETTNGVQDPFASAFMGGTDDTATDEPNAGVVLGIALASFRHKVAPGEVVDHFLLLPGDDVQLTFPTVPADDKPPKAAYDSFTVVDLYESKMSEYDSSFVFVPIDVLQRNRGMIDPTTGASWVSAIEIKLKPDADGNVVRDKIAAAFSPNIYQVETWCDKQGALLAAVQMETAILNVLLFFIIAVAGFGILAIFLMIVVEKTRDIGILKSLGASSLGVMQIFLSYGLSLGVVGSGAGMVLGLLFVRYINEIADGLGRLTGKPVFSPEIYYFYEIPTHITAATIAWIVGGALAIAVLASVLPACRAARLHPVEALRYE